MPFSPAAISQSFSIIHSWCQLLFGLQFPQGPLRADEAEPEQSSHSWVSASCGLQRRRPAVLPRLRRALIYIPNKRRGATGDAMTFQSLSCIALIFSLWSSSETCASVFSLFCSSLEASFFQGFNRTRWSSCNTSQKHFTSNSNAGDR